MQMCKEGRLVVPWSVLEREWSGRGGGLGHAGIVDGWKDGQAAVGGYDVPGWLGGGGGFWLL